MIVLTIGELRKAIADFSDDATVAIDSGMEFRDLSIKSAVSGGHTYVSLGSAGNLDSSVEEIWMGLDWNQKQPSPASPAEEEKPKTWWS